MSDTNGLSGTLTIPSSISSGLPEVEGSGKALVSVSGEWAEQDGYGYTDENDTVHLMDSKYIPQNANLNALTDLGTALGVDMTSCTADTDAEAIQYIADNYTAPAQLDSNLEALTDLGTSLGVDMTSCTAVDDAEAIQYIADNYTAPSGLPGVSDSGKALVSVNGEWTEQDGYGYSVNTPQSTIISETTVAVNSANGIATDADAIEAVAESIYAAYGNGTINDGTAVEITYNGTTITKTLTVGEMQGSFALMIGDYGNRPFLGGSFTAETGGEYVDGIIAFPTGIDSATFTVIVPGQTLVTQIDSKYIPSGLPEVSGSGKALVSVNGEWVEQDGYGHTVPIAAHAITWNGQPTEVSASINGRTYYKISDEVILDYTGVGIAGYYNKHETNNIEYTVQPIGGISVLLVDNNKIAIISTNMLSVSGITFPETGTYSTTFVDADLVDVSVRRISIPARESISAIDTKYMPPTTITLLVNDPDASSDHTYAEIKALINAGIPITFKHSTEEGSMYTSDFYEESNGIMVSANRFDVNGPALIHHEVYLYANDTCESYTAVYALTPAS